MVGGEISGSRSSSLKAWLTTFGTTVCVRSSSMRFFRSRVRAYLKADCLVTFRKPFLLFLIFNHSLQPAFSRKIVLSCVFQTTRPDEYLFVTDRNKDNGCSNSFTLRHESNLRNHRKPTTNMVELPQLIIECNKRWSPA